MGTERSQGDRKGRCRMSVQCCGAVRRGSYCSVCGKQLYHTPLAELYSHLVTEVARMETRAEHSKLPKHSKVVEKWRRWRDALGKVRADYDV